MNQSPEMIPIFLTFGLIGFFTIGVLFLIFSSISIKSADQGNRSKDGIPSDFRDQFIQAYHNVFSTYNLKPMEGMLTDFFYYSTQNTVKLLSKLGIKKEVTVKIDPAFDQIKHTSLVLKDGKNDMTVDITKCDYTETYREDHTNKKIYQRTLKNATFNIELLKTNETLKKDITHCMNCGDVLKRQGNFFDCPSCGAHYASENLKWSASNVSVEPDSTGFSRSIVFCVIAWVLLSLVEMIIKNKPLGMAISAIDILLIIATAGYLAWIYRSIRVMKQMVANDPKASQMVFQKRAHYLIRNLEMARDWHLEDIKPFMTPALYEKIKQKNEYDDYFVVDLTFKKVIPTKYQVKDQIQIIDFDITYEQLLMNPKRKIKCTKQKKHFALYKSIHALTKVNASAQAIICPNCGSNINRITDGICSYCQASVNVADFDWIFYDAPIAMTK